MVDRQALIDELSQYGIVNYCDSHLDIYYLIVVDNWLSDIVTFDAIADKYVLTDYPYQTVITFVDGTIKTQYNNGYL